MPRTKGSAKSSPKKKASSTKKNTSSRSSPKKKKVIVPDNETYGYTKNQIKDLSSTEINYLKKRKAALKKELLNNEKARQKVSGELWDQYEIWLYDDDDNFLSENTKMAIMLDYLCNIYVIHEIERMREGKSPIPNKLGNKKRNRTF